MKPSKLKNNLYVFSRRQEIFSFLEHPYFTAAETQQKETWTLMEWETMQNQHFGDMT